MALRCGGHIRSRCSRARPSGCPIRLPGTKLHGSRAPSTCGGRRLTRASVGFLDVGQGDCVVAVDAATAQAVVVDCPDGGADVAVASARDAGASVVAVLFITHLHADHAGDALDVAREMHAAEVRINLGRRFPVSAQEKSKLTAALRAFAALEDEGAVVNRTAHQGDAGRTGIIEWTVLWPTYGAVLGSLGSGDTNRASLILRFDVEGRRFLVAGDADGRDWHQARASGVELAADVLLVPHHGAEMPERSGRMSIDEVLDAVGARHHVVSVATNNTYGHPHPETLRALGERAASARVLCTEVNATCLGGVPLPAAEAGRLPTLALIGSGLLSPERCPCAGSVRFTLSEVGWETAPSTSQHATVIDVLAAPQCRLAARTDRPD